MRVRKKKNLSLRMGRCARLLIDDAEGQRGKWRQLMSGAAELRVELGCGKGRFTCMTAAEHPEVLFVALERIPDVLVTAMERAQAEGLSNVFFICGDAAKLSEYFAANEVDLIYINFCDPWPSRKHAPRRLSGEGFLSSYRSVLRLGGQIHFKTDNEDLFSYSLPQFQKAGYVLSEVTHDLHADGTRGVMTDYEEKFHNMGIPIKRLVGTKQ